MSGFTTTGATVVADVDALDRSILLWRQMTQWLGGMGIVVLALAVLPRLRIGGRQIFESELPGPEVNQLAERIRDTARRIWMLYIGLTLVLIAALLLVGAVGLDDSLSPFDAIGNALSTIPLGGFATVIRSLEPFAPVTQWIVALFMALAGVNFALLYRTLVRGDARALRRDEEARLYGVLLLLGSVVVFAALVHADLFSGATAVRQAFFQTTSLMTGTGFAITDYATWPALAVMAMIGLMFVGASAGSPTGSVKIVRHLLVGRILRRELRQTIHPELVLPIRLNGQPVEERTLRAILAFVLLYIGIFVVGTGLLAIDARIANVDLGITEAVAASAGTLGNVGPALGFAGPMGSYAPFSDFSKLVMALLMWIGRLEVLPVLVLLTRGYWRV
jgi:trk system potassium uptake protein TrkH